MTATLRSRLRRSRYIRDVAWQASGNGLAQVLAVLAMPVIARLYSPAQFATLNLFAQVVAGLAIVLTLRLEYLVVLPRTDAQAHALLRWLAWFGAVLALPASLVAWLEAEMLARLLGDMAVAPWLVLAPPTAWLVSVSIGVQQAVQRRQEYRHTSISEVLNKGGYIASSFVGATWLPNPIGLVCATGVGAAAKALWLWHALRAGGWLGRGVDCSADLRSHARIAGSLVFSNLLGMVTATAPMVFIVHMYGADMLGQFGLVVSTLNLPSALLGQAIGQVYYQRAARHRAQGESFFYLWSTTAWQLLRIGGPLFVAVALLSPWAYPLLFGTQWEVAGRIAPVMVFAAGLSFASSPLDRTCLVLGAWWYVPLWHGLRAASVLAVMSVAARSLCSFDTFIWLLVAQMSLMYLIDWAANGWFAYQGAKP